MQNRLKFAVSMLVKKCSVIPEKYTHYRKGYLFLAYPIGMKDKSKALSPYYLVNLETKSVGPFSPAFDIEGFFNAVENLKPLRE